MSRALKPMKKDSMFLAWVASHSISHVSRQCKVDRMTVRKYRELERWDARERELNQNFIEAALGTVQEYRNRCLRAVQALLDDFQARLQSNDVQIKSVRDFIRVAELGLVLRGEATDIHGVQMLGSAPIEAGSAEGAEETRKLEESIRRQEARLKVVRNGGAIEAEFKEVSRGDKDKDGPKGVCGKGADHDLSVEEEGVGSSGGDVPEVRGAGSAGALGDDGDSRDGDDDGAGRSS